MIAERWAQLGQHLFAMDTGPVATLRALPIFTLALALIDLLDESVGIFPDVNAKRQWRGVHVYSSRNVRKVVSCRHVQRIHRLDGVGGPLVVP